MNDFYSIAIGAGLQDGLNPCIFMTCTAFIVYGLWLKERSSFFRWFGIYFVVAYALSSLNFDFGLAQLFLLKKHFLMIARIFYFALGVWAFILGVIFFKDWVLLSRGLPLPDRAIKQINPSFFRAAGVYVMTVLMAMGLSCLSNLWPINKYIVIFGNEEISQGQWLVVLPLLVTYTLISMWPIWFVWAFLSIKNLRPSMLRIVCASIFFTASSCAIFIFK